MVSGQGSGIRDQGSGIRDQGAPEGRKRVAQGDGEAGALGIGPKIFRALEEGDRKERRA